MITDPWFWHEDSVSARLVARMLSPAGYVYHKVARIKQALAKPTTLDRGAVICVGNATLGGVGKTPFAIMLHQLLHRHGRPAAFLSRGYGGALGGPVVVDRALHGARSVGDEALLLARHGDVWVARNRGAGARHACSSGHRLLIADDGLQNPYLPKDFSFLLLGENTLGANTHIFPAGPFREPVADAVERADMVVFMRPDMAQPLPERMVQLAADKPWCQAELYPVAEGSGRVHGFCGIGQPRRFAASLTQAGYEVIGFTAFPDHHRYRDEEIKALRIEAKKADSVLITTEKDGVRLSEAQARDIDILPVAMRVDAPELLWAVLEEKLPMPIIKKG